MHVDEMVNLTIIIITWHHYWSTVTRFTTWLRIGQVKFEFPVNIFPSPTDSGERDCGKYSPFHKLPTCNTNRNSGWINSCTAELFNPEPNRIVPENEFFFCNLQKQLSNLKQHPRNQN